MVQAEILAVLRRRGGAVSAYDVLTELREDNPTTASPTICRALAAPTGCGRVHRLGSLDRLIACRCDLPRKTLVLSVRGDCGSVADGADPDLSRQLSGILGRSGFRPVRHVLEVHGHCAACEARQVPG